MTYEEALALLAFQVEAGAGEAFADEPVNRYELAAEPAGSAERRVAAESGEAGTPAPRRAPLA
ncbi:MAG: uracil-DNA glycosylase, partial [Parvibaculum sp.]